MRDRLRIHRPRSGIIVSEPGVGVMRVVVVVSILLMALGASGCVATSEGAATPFPTRPYALDVAAVDPCAALTVDQRNAMNLREGRAGTSHGGTSRGCTWPSNDGVGYTVQTFGENASVTLGAEATATVVTVDGFGAVQSSPPAQGTGLPFCQVVLDVADNASLRAQLQISPRGAKDTEHTTDSTCAQIREVASLMLETLHARQQR